MTTILTVCFLVLPGIASSGQGVSEPGVAGVILHASPTTFSGACPATISFTGKITVNGRLTARYRFERSDGTSTPTQSISFGGPGQKPVSTSWTPPLSSGVSIFEGWIVLRILTPNEVVSERANFSVRCTGGYTITDLGESYKFGSRALAVNRDGHVMGHFRLNDRDGCTHAFLYKGGTFHDLGSLEGGGACSYGTAINDLEGGAVNASRGLDGDYTAFRYLPPPPDSGRLSSLGLIAGHTHSYAYGNNNGGLVVGESVKINTPPEQTRAFLYAVGSGVKDLGTLGGARASAMDINNSGVVVGWSWTTATDPARREWYVFPGHAFVYRRGGMQDLNDLVSGGEWELRKANAINDSGHVVGFAHHRTRNEVRAFKLVLDTRAFENLGTFDDRGGFSYALAVNNHGQAVGAFEHLIGTDEDKFRACIFKGGKAHNLNNMISSTAGWVLREATGINVRGQIAGWGYKGGREHAFLLTPID